MSLFEFDIETRRTESVVDCASILEREVLQIFDRHLAQYWNLSTCVRPK